MIQSADALELPGANGRIAIAAEEEAQRWCRKLGCSARELDQALRAVGRDLPKLRAHISRERASRASGRTLYQHPSMPARRS